MTQPNATSFSAGAGIALSFMDYKRTIYQFGTAQAGLAFFTPVTLGATALTRTGRGPS
jgi:hypothetical protein